MSSLFPRSATQVIASNGYKAAGAKIYFFEPGTTTPRIVYSDSALSVPFTFPILADANGVIPVIYLNYGTYRVRTTTAGDVVLTDIDNVSNPAPPDSGGGGSVPVNQLYQTGWSLWLPKTGDENGFIIMNGKTIGSAASGATGRANPDTANLYFWYWNNLADTYAPVGGGRGANAGADFNANKTLQLLNMQGKGPFGLDDMGGNAGNVIQRSTTITTTNGSTAATVAANTGIAIGMQIVSTNVAAGTTVADIAGTAVTLSAPATGTGSLIAARFSAYRDAQAPGASGGYATRNLIQRELPTSIGEAVTTLSNATSVFRGGVLGAQAGGTANTPSVISDITAATTISNNTGGYPHLITPPSVLGTWYQKL